MIKAAILKNTSIPMLQRRARFCASDGWAFSVQSGLLVMRAPEGRVFSVPLSDVQILEGCPAAPPKAGK